MPNFRTHFQQDTDLMPYKEISDRLGLGGAASARQIYTRAMWKLRLRWGSRKAELRELYTPEPENPGRVGKNWKVSELPLSRFPLQPRKRG